MNGILFDESILTKFRQQPHWTRVMDEMANIEVLKRLLNMNGGNNS